MSRLHRFARDFAGSLRRWTEVDTFDFYTHAEALPARPLAAAGAVPTRLQAAAVAEPASDTARGQSAPAPAAGSAKQAPGVRLQLHGVSKRFGEREVLHPIDLTVEPGEFIAIVGRSGCGKSTLLRLVAGLEAPSQGAVELDGVRARGLNEETRIMFQDARLLPWKPVIDNVALGLPKAQRQRALDVLAQVGLADRSGEWPANLSGGQRQRVALARALVHQPRLLLLDEPLGALDALTRIEMHALIEGLWRRLGFTALLVTHDVQEAVALADRVLLIEDGAIALDERVSLPHPRERGSAAFAALEKRILDRVLATPEAPSPASGADQHPPQSGGRPVPPHDPLSPPAARWQWAI